MAISQESARRHRCLALERRAGKNRSASIAVEKMADRRQHARFTDLWSAMRRIALSSSQSGVPRLWHPAKDYEAA
jgi:hypothetical protein